MNERKRKRIKNRVISFPSSSLLPDKNNMAAKVLQFPYCKLTKGKMLNASRLPESESREGLLKLNFCLFSPTKAWNYQRFIKNLLR